MALSFGAPDGGTRHDHVGVHMTWQRSNLKTMPAAVRTRDAELHRTEAGLPGLLNAQAAGTGGYIEEKHAGERDERAAPPLPTPELRRANHRNRRELVHGCCEPKKSPSKVVWEPHSSFLTGAAFRPNILRQPATVSTSKKPYAAANAVRVAIALSRSARLQRVQSRFSKRIGCWPFPVRAGAGYTILDLRHPLANHANHRPALC